MSISPDFPINSQLILQDDVLRKGDRTVSLRFVMSDLDHSEPAMTLAKDGVHFFQAAVGGLGIEEVSVRVVSYDR